MSSLRKIFPVLILASFIANTSSAKIWRVNNNVGVNANFTTFTAAINSASVLAGDTLHIEASSTPYSEGQNITLNKRLVILGTGYFLTQNPKTQANINPSVAVANTVLFINNGASGSIIMGLSINSISISDVSNLTISRNRVEGINLNSVNQGGTGNNILIQDNFLGGIGFNFGTTSVAYTNFRLENNIIYGAVTLQFLTSGQIINNYIVGGVNATNCLIKNNYFNNVSGATASNIIQFNIFETNNTSFVGTNGNITAAATTVFVNPSTNPLQDAGFMLKAGSPGFGAGRDANGNPTDIGPFGNTNPYVLSGMPPIPSIYQLTVPQNVPAGTPSMNVNISTISRN